MEHDALTAGVSPGGLIDYHQILLLICYMLRHVGQPMVQEHITSIIYENGLANFFEVNAAIGDLMERGHITSSQDPDTGDIMLQVTESGREVAVALESDLPLSVRERAVTAAVQLLARRNIERQNQVDIVTRENGVAVTCHVSDGKHDLMALTLLVGDRMQAEAIREHFLSNPTRVYQGVLALQTGDMDSFVDLLRQEGSSF